MKTQVLGNMISLEYIIHQITQKHRLLPDFLGLHNLYFVGILTNIWGDDNYKTEKATNKKSQVIPQ